MMSTGVSPTYGDLLVDLAGWTLRGCGLWAALIAVAAVVEAGSRGRVRATSWVAAPPALRRALLAGLGVLLAGAVPGPVFAAVSPGGARPDALAPSAGPTPLPVPVRPGDGRPPSRVVVRHGDTLWALAACRLPDDAGQARVLAGVQRWYARNRAVIGPDPDLLLPGQRLRPGTPSHRTCEEHR